MIKPGSIAVDELVDSLDFLRQNNIPLVITTCSVASEVLKAAAALNSRDPFIVEGGGAIYIPEETLSITYNYDHIEGGYRIVELGMTRDAITANVVELREEYGYPVYSLSEIQMDELSGLRDSIDPAILNSSIDRKYSGLVHFDNDKGSFVEFQTEAEARGLRIREYSDNFLITGDHDEGSALRFLVQLYREEYVDKKINTIGLGYSQQDAPILYAVDQAVLVRMPDGKFDSHVGRRGLKFTQIPGPEGWNQAVLAILTGEEG